MLKGIYQFSHTFPDLVDKKYIIYSGGVSELQGVNIINFLDTYKSIDL